MEQTKQTLS